MMSNKNIRDILKYWVLPKGFQDVLIKLFSGDWKKQGVSNGYLDILKNNKKFKNIHEGKRCFIIANGPSIKTQDLRLLKNEICFSSFIKIADTQFFRVSSR